MALHHGHSSAASVSTSTSTSTSTASSSFSSSSHPTCHSRFRRRCLAFPSTLTSSILSLLFLLTITFPFSDASLLYPFDGGLGAGLQDADQLQIAAYGDFNSDKETDVFIIGHTRSNNTDHYHVWCYFQNGAWFARANDVTVTVDQPIEQIVPGDFNHDGALDLLLMTHTSIPSQYQLSIYYGHFTSYTTSYLIPNMTSSHVLVLDINNDLRLDLFGVNQLGERAIWINSAGTDGNVVMTMNKQELPSPSLIPTLTYPHSSAFTDLNGDCLSDLIIPTSNTTHSQLEIWINHKADGMKLERVYEIPHGMGAISVADVNGDGTLDILFPVCWPRPSCSINASIHIIYNNQKPMCSSVWESSPSCRSQTGLCEADDGWTLGLSSERTDVDHVIVDHKAWNNDIFTSDITLRMGDIDLDGYPDILVTLMNPTTFTRHISILHNDACSSSTCTQAANNADRRTFSRYTYGTEDLESLSDATIASWLDIGNDGNLDVLVTRNTTSQGMTLHTYRNNYQVDAYFLTTLGSNGVCPAWCPSGARFPSPKPYGVNHPGISIKLTVTDLSGSKSPRQGTQLSQSTHFALQMPYNIFGLGRTNNYIEEFFVGVPLSYSQHWQSWVAIIPNAQLIIFPYEPDTPSDWTLELFISPSSRLRWVIAAWLTCIGALVLTIGFFHWRERQADREEMKRNELLFAF